MATSEQATVTALNLTGQAADLLDSVGDRAGSLRLKHAAAVIRNDASFSSPQNLQMPLSLMQIALALIDQYGDASGAGLHLQAAIDVARGASPLGAMDTIDPDLIAPLLVSLPPQSRNS